MRYLSDLHTSAHLGPLCFHVHNFHSISGNLETTPKSIFLENTGKPHQEPVCCTVAEQYEQAFMYLGTAQN